MARPRRNRATFNAPARFLNRTPFWSAVRCLIGFITMSGALAKYLRGFSINRH
jgi:hypothetical protein